MGETREPLLQNNNNKKKVYYDKCPGCKVDQRKDIHPGIPIKEFFYVWIVVLCNALPIASLYPFLYFMIRDLHITKGEEDIGFYTGFVGASFMLGRALTSVLWGVISDRYGRKPVIMIGTVSVVIFNTLFGLSTSFWMAIATRFFLGIMNGLLGTIKAYASEVCRAEHQALGLSLISPAWGIGLIIGPAIGGFLAQPAEKFPDIISKDSLFGRFPYFLPCLSISSIAVVVSIACFWLPETLHMNHENNFEEEGSYEALEESSNRSDNEGHIRENGKMHPESKKSLLTNWPLMSSVLVYCIYSLHDNAYSEISIVTGLFVLQNNAVEQHQRGAANGIAMTGMSLFKAFGPAIGGVLFSWAQKRGDAYFLPGSRMIFFVLNVISAVALIMTFKPFLWTPAH